MLKPLLLDAIGWYIYVLPNPNKTTFMKWNMKSDYHKRSLNPIWLHLNISRIDILNLLSCVILSWMRHFWCYNSSLYNISSNPNLSEIVRESPISWCRVVWRHAAVCLTLQINADFLVIFIMIYCVFVETRFCIPMNITVLFTTL